VFHVTIKELLKRKVDARSTNADFLEEIFSKACTKKSGCVTQIGNIDVSTKRNLANIFHDLVKTVYPYRHPMAPLKKRPLTKITLAALFWITHQCDAEGTCVERVDAQHVLFGHDIISFLEDLTVDEVVTILRDYYNGSSKCAEEELHCIAANMITIMYSVASTGAIRAAQETVDKMFDLSEDEHAVPALVEQILNAAEFDLFDEQLNFLVQLDVFQRECRRNLTYIRKRFLTGTNKPGTMANIDAKDLIGAQIEVDNLITALPPALQRAYYEVQSVVKQNISKKHDIRF
jgi:hypothetical protein